MIPSLLLGAALLVGEPPTQPPASVGPPVLPFASQEGFARQSINTLQTLDLNLEVPPLAPPTSPQAANPVNPPAEPGAFMQLLQGTWYGAILDDNRTSISGWTEASFTASTDRHNQLPMGFNYLANNFSLQQNWLRIQREVEESATTPTWGFLLDTILPGSDYRFTIARGLFDQQLTANRGNPNLDGIDPVQFYTEFYLPGVGEGLDLKLGRFFAQFGVESIDTVLNPFVSRSYTFIYNPFTNTGLLSTLKLSGDWSIENGLATGSDVFIDRAANPTYLGGLKWTPPDNRASAIFEVILGNGRYDRVNNFNNPEIFDLVLTRKLSDRLMWTGEGLYGFETNVPSIGFANWYGVVNYLNYEFDKRWIANTRLEVFDDPQGQRTGYKGVYEAITSGVTYKPFPFLWFRPEVRYDHNDSHPFEGKSSLFTTAFDCVILW